MGYGIKLTEKQWDELRRRYRQKGMRRQLPGERSALRWILISHRGGEVRVGTVPGAAESMGTELQATAHPSRRRRA